MHFLIEFCRIIFTACKRRCSDEIMCLMYKVGRTGIAVGIDHIDELVKGAVKNVEKDPVASPLLSSQQLQFFTGDGRKGYEPLAPYDAIHVGAAAAQIPQSVSKNKTSNEASESSVFWGQRSYTHLCLTKIHGSNTKRKTYSDVLVKSDMRCHSYV